MEQELTEWFPAHMRPNFIGVYEVRSVCGLRGPWYAYWSGEGWLSPYMDREFAYERRNVDPLSSYQNKVWRGLTRPIE